ncbi:MAG: ChaN family lipoprotein, partial [Phycisphaerae bacterium]|nr:ChaN family lipoprotein [Phycisphaerae bacterium]
MPRDREIPRNRTHRSRPRSVLGRSAALIGVLGASAGCSNLDPFGNPFQDPRPGWATVPSDPFAPRGLPMFDGTRGTVLTWFDLSQAVDWADVIVIGERHDDAVAHAVQLAIVEETMARFPRTALSMEMLERDEQPAVDDYLRGVIEVDEFMERTGSRHWAGKDTWVLWYQPMIDAAKVSGSRVIAANSPRRFVRQARLEGYEALAALPPEERALFDFPRRLDKPAYRARFDEVIRHGHGDEPASDEGLAAGFRSQSLWDSTMAASIVRARGGGGAPPGGAPAANKVVHLVGQFHSDFTGGLVEELHARDGGLRICVISVQSGTATELRPEDRDRAAIVMYSGTVHAPRPVPTPPPEPPPASGPLPLSIPAPPAAPEAPTPADAST